MSFLRHFTVETYHGVNINASIAVEKATQQSQWWWSCAWPLAMMKYLSFSQQNNKKTLFAHFQIIKKNSLIQLKPDTNLM